MTAQLDKAAVVTNLNKILELEFTGVVRYTHYALMIFGYNRIPIVSWMQAQAMNPWPMPGRPVSWSRISANIPRWLSVRCWRATSTTSATSWANPWNTSA
jgi:hypothetical protein